MIDNNIQQIALENVARGGEKLEIINRNGGKKRRSPKQMRMIDETIRAMVASKTQSDASTILEISTQALVHRLSKYPEIREGIEKVRQFTVNHLKNRLSFVASSRVDNILELGDRANSETVRLQANIELLDRAGFTKPSNGTGIQVNVLNNLQKDREQFDL